MADDGSGILTLLPRAVAKLADAVDDIWERRRVE